MSGKVRKRESKIHTAGVSFKLFRRVDSLDNFNLVRRKITPLKTARQSNCTSKDGFGFCPNVTFEDDEFKEDNTALNDQGEDKGNNSFLSSLNSASVGSDLIMGRIPAHPPTETLRHLQAT